MAISRLLLLWLILSYAQSYLFPTFFQHLPLFATLSLSVLNLDLELQFIESLRQIALIGLARHCSWIDLRKGALHHLRRFVMDKTRPVNGFLCFLMTLALERCDNIALALATGANSVLLTVVKVDVGQAVALFEFKRATHSSCLAFRDMLEANSDFLVNKSVPWVQKERVWTANAALKA